MVKKRINHIILCLLLLPCGRALAQKPNNDGGAIRAYLSAGATFSQIEGDMLKGYKKLGFGAGIGAITPISTTGRWHLSIEMGYAERGVRERSRDILTQYRIKGMTMGYIDIPLMIHFTDPYGGVMVGAGLCYGVLVRKPHGTIQYSPTYVVPDTSNMGFERNDIAATLGLRFPIWKQHLWLHMRWQYSLMPVKRDWIFREYRTTDDYTEYHNDCYNNSITLRLIWRM